MHLYFWKEFHLFKSDFEGSGHILFLMFPSSLQVVMLLISLHIPKAPMAVLNRAKAAQEPSAYLTEECK